MVTINRRQSLAFGSAAAAMALSGQSLAAAPQGLHTLAQTKGLGFGTAFNAGKHATYLAAPETPAVPRPNPFDDAALRQLLVNECGMIVPGNEMKWYSLRPNGKTYTFDPADQLVAFVKDNHLKMRGHTLLWNDPKWMPAWLTNVDFGSSPRAGAEKMLREHITTVCTRYRDVLFSWDVINETFDHVTGEMYPSVFTKAIGPEVIDWCFHTAREAAPKAELVFNDFMCWEPGNAAHYAGVLKLLERLKKNNVPVDALGIQSHIGSNKAPGVEPSFFQTDQTAWRKFLDEVTAMGYGLVVTELDVNDKGIAGDIPTRDKAVASLTKDYLDLILSYKQTRYVMAWGLVDKYSWEQSFAPRLDGLPRRPSPYDDNYHSKPMREAIAEAFRHAPVRPSTLG